MKLAISDITCEINLPIVATKNPAGSHQDVDNDTTSDMCYWVENTNACVVGGWKLEAYVLLGGWVGTTCRLSQWISGLLNIDNLKLVGTSLFNLDFCMDY